MPEIPQPARRLLDRVPPRRLALLLAVSAALAVAAIGLAAALDRPVGAGARDQARPVVAGDVRPPGGDLAAADGDLPPLALVLDRPLPDGIGRLPPGEQLSRLRELAFTRGEARRVVELAVLYQRLGDQGAARATYREALKLDPNDVAARAGLAMAEGARGGDGLDRAAAALRRLAMEQPDSQLVAFNEGWLAVYRREAQAAGRAWRRTVRLDPNSPLGRTASSLLKALGGGASGRQP